jgi:hypothetical protein
MGHNTEKHAVWAHSSNAVVDIRNGAEAEVLLSPKPGFITSERRRQSVVVHEAHRR